MYVCGYKNVCETDRQTGLLLQILSYLSLSYIISVVPVECIMKEIRPAMHSFCCTDFDISYVFRLCEVAIIGLLISEVWKLKLYFCSLT